MTKPSWAFGLPLSTMDKLKSGTSEEGPTPLCKLCNGAMSLSRLYRRLANAETYQPLQGSGSVLATRNLHLVRERDSMHAWDLSDEGGIHEHSQFLHLKLRSARLEASAAGEVDMKTTASIWYTNFQKLHSL